MNPIKGTLNTVMDETANDIILRRLDTIEKKLDKLLSNKEKEQKVVKSTEKKKKYLQHVYLTEDEVKKLRDEYGDVKARKMITELNNYKGANGKTYKSDYLAILNWVVAKVSKDIPANTEYMEKMNERNKKLYGVGE